MSHYVYLDACPLPRMPDGAVGEWRGFWTERPVELEAKNWPPLLWWCLFGEEDLRRARLIDNIDADDPEGERAAPLEQMGEGAGAMHPYLVH